MRFGNRTRHWDIWRIFSLLFVLVILLELVLITCMASAGRSRRVSRCCRKGSLREKYELDVEYEELNDLRVRRTRWENFMLGLFIIFFRNFVFLYSSSTYIISTVLTVNLKCRSIEPSFKFIEKDSNVSPWVLGQPLARCKRETVGLILLKDYLFREISLIIFLPSIGWCSTTLVVSSGKSGYWNWKIKFKKFESSWRAPEVNSRLCGKKFLKTFFRRVYFCFSFKLTNAREVQYATTQWGVIKTLLFFNEGAFVDTIVTSNATLKAHLWMLPLLGALLWRLFHASPPCSLHFLHGLLFYERKKDHRVCQPTSDAQTSHPLKNRLFSLLLINVRTARANLIASLTELLFFSLAQIMSYGSSVFFSAKTVFIVWFFFHCLVFSYQSRNLSSWFVLYFIMCLSLHFFLLFSLPCIASAFKITPFRLIRPFYSFMKNQAS